MNKIEAIKKELKQAKELSQTDHLEAVLYEFVKLHESMSNDAYKRDTEAGGRIKQFDFQLQDFEKLAETVKNDIRTSIRKEAENTAVYFSKTIGEGVHKEVEPTMRKLRDVIDQSERALSRYQTSIGFANWEMVVVSVVSSLLFSLLAVWWLMPKPTLPLTSQQMRYLVTGESFNEIWTKLSKADKEQFKKLAKKNGMIIHN